MPWGRAACGWGLGCSAWARGGEKGRKTLSVYIEVGERVSVQVRGCVRGVREDMREYRREWVMCERGEKQMET